MWYTAKCTRVSSILKFLRKIFVNHQSKPEKYKSMQNYMWYTAKHTPVPIILYASQIEGQKREY